MQDLITVAHREDVEADAKPCGFRSAFGVMSAYRDVAVVVTGPMRVSGRDI